MPVQVQRLLIAFAIFIALFLVARHFLRPASFGEYGHYRGDALKENEDKPIHYVDVNETCVMCHDSIAAVRDSSVHHSVDCQTCHGPGNEHVEDPQKTNIVKEHSREFCGRCHAKNPARGKVIKQIDIEEHNKEDECITCHNSHNPVLW